MKKKLLAVLLASTMVFSLAGCGSTGETKTEEPAVAEETAEETTEETATEEAATEETAEETTGKKWVIATDTAFKFVIAKGFEGSLYSKSSLIGTICVLKTEISY